MKKLCKNCDKIVSEWLSKEFFEMTEGNGVVGCKYTTFLKRLENFVKETTGNINTQLYINNFRNKLKKYKDFK